ncbi:hypothetical protein CJF32_00010591 [Rutstroemia sp. NJR-2017a WRK4]|nr:hypothetical protein CJF32_00010591 [Rutstroemia sp. NJR-2017a WRK4]
MHTISSFQDKWKDIHLDGTCLMCLCRRPEYGLPCGHSFCGIDIQRFGAILDNDPHRFIVNSCFLCSQDTHGAQFRFKPKTKGVNVLGIDGGGVRGVIPLQSLLLLEQKLKLYLPDFPIQNLFDVAFGTSSGGLIVMAMFLNGLPVTECMEVFEKLSLKTFDRGFISSNSIFSRLRELLISYFADSLYSAHNLEEGLQAQFGDKTSLMDHSAATSKGAKVGITVTGVPNAALIFTNYNGVGSRLSKSGYRHILSDDTSNRVRVWEAYLLPYYIKKIGKKLQDGGLWRNNPIDIALSEARKLWPTITEPDIVLSLGTGYQVNEDAEMSDPSPTETSPLFSSPVIPTDLGRAEIAMATTLQDVQQPRGLWRSGFITRCLESFLSTMDGQKFYDLPNQWNRAADDMKRYFRLNVQLQGKTPALDDVVLTVRDLQVLIPISLRFGNSNRSIIEGRNISASPFTVNGLLEAQGWNSSFGRADHGPTEPDDIARLTLERKRASKTIKRHSKARSKNISKRQRR